ncbi:MAG: hypothetical protein ACRC24_08010 [Vibrionaceae bacterium]
MATPIKPTESPTPIATALFAGVLTGLAGSRPVLVVLNSGLFVGGDIGRCRALVMLDEKFNAGLLAGTVLLAAELVVGFALA